MSEQSQTTTLICGNSIAAREFAALLNNNGHDFLLHLPDSADIVSFWDGYQYRIVREAFEMESKVGDIVIVDFSIIHEHSAIPSIVHDLIIQRNALYLAASSVCTATALSKTVHSASTAIISGISGFTKNKGIECAISLLADETLSQKVQSYVQNLGFEVQFLEDRVGLVSPRILATLINEAAFAVQEKVASCEDIDNAMKLGVNYPKGLLSWGDEIGLDFVLALLDGLYEEYHQERYRAAVILRQYVRAGRMGTMSGHGFYSY